MRRTNTELGNKRSRHLRRLRDRSDQMLAEFGLTVCIIEKAMSPKNGRVA